MQLKEIMADIGVFVVEQSDLLPRIPFLCRGVAGDNKMLPGLVCFNRAVFCPRLQFEVAERIAVVHKNVGEKWLVSPISGPVGMHVLPEDTPLPDVWNAFLGPLVTQIQDEAEINDVMAEFSFKPAPESAAQAEFAWGQITGLLLYARELFLSAPGVNKNLFWCLQQIADTHWEHVADRFARARYIPYCGWFFHDGETWKSVSFCVLTKAARKILLLGDVSSDSDDTQEMDIGPLVLSHRAVEQLDETVTDLEAE